MTIAKSCGFILVWSFVCKGGEFKEICIETSS